MKSKNPRGPNFDGPFICRIRKVDVGPRGKFVFCYCTDDSPNMFEGDASLSIDDRLIWLDNYEPGNGDLIVIWDVRVHGNNLLRAYLGRGLMPDDDLQRPIPKSEREQGETGSLEPPTRMSQLKEFLTG